MDAFGGLRGRTVVILIGCLLAGCGGADTQVAPDPSGPSPPSSNSPPTLSGTPPTIAFVGRAYTFQPTATDSNGDTLGFSIVNRPPWASFSTATGRLAGTPEAGASSIAGIVISVSDGNSSTSLAPFTLEVVDDEPGTAALTWQAPTAHVDETALSDLAGFRVYSGSSADSLEFIAEVRDPARTSLALRGLAAGVRYFAVTAISSAGVESAFSNVQSKQVR